MTDDDTPDEQTQATDAESSSGIEKRVASLEAGIEAIDVPALQERLSAIESRQKRLDEQIGALDDSVREDSDLVPHIDTVEQLYRSLAEAESQMSRVAEQLEELRDEVESGDEST